MLYLISTPIGNLGDFSFRAVHTLMQCDYLLCEDTRRSVILLNHYELQKPLRSYHKFNESRKMNEVIADLKEGKVIGLLSDAGTPCIADPGYLLVRQCRQEGIEVVTIPGPSAILTALAASGFATDRFQFIGFLPKKKGELTRLLEEALAFPGTTVCFESPFRLKATLKVLETLAPTLVLCVARELTKKFEAYVYGTPAFLLEKWKEKPPKGEIVLLIPSPN